MSFVDTLFPLPWRSKLRLVAQISLLRTSYYSARHRGVLVVARGSRIFAGRASRIIFTSGSRLYVGLAPYGERGAVIDLSPGSTMTVSGKVSVLRGSTIRLSWNAQLRIGDRAYFNAGSRIECSTSITIGARCAVAFNAIVMDSDAHVLSDARHQIDPDKHHDGVLLGDDCWLGANSVVLKGVTLAPGTVVGAAAVVTKSVTEPRCLLTGVPATLARRDVTWT